MRLSRLAAIAALGLGLVLLTVLSVLTAPAVAQTPTAATPRPGTPPATPRPATPTAAAPAATPTVAATATRAATPVTPTPTRAITPTATPRATGATGAGGGLDGQYVTALWVVGWGLVTLSSLYLVLRRRRA